MTGYILPYSAFYEKPVFVLEGLLSVAQGEDRSPFPRRMEAELHTLHQFGRRIGLQTGGEGRMEGAHASGIEDLGEHLHAPIALSAVIDDIDRNGDLLADFIGVLLQYGEDILGVESFLHRIVGALGEPPIVDDRPLNGWVGVEEEEGQYLESAISGVFLNIELSKGHVLTVQNHPPGIFYP